MSNPFPDPVEIPENLEGVTHANVTALLERVKGEIAHIENSDAPKTIEDTRRVRALKRFRNELTTLDEEFTADKEESEREAAEAKAAAETAAAEAEQAEAAAVEAAETAANEAAVVAAAEEAVAEADVADADMAAMSAELDTTEGPTMGEGVVTEPAPVEPEIVNGHLGRRMYSNMGAQRTMLTEGMTAGLATAATNMDEVGHRVASLVSTARTVEGDDTQYLFRTDMNEGAPVTRMGMQASLNREIVANAGRDTDGMMAALCGIPTILEGRGVCCDSSRPVAESFSGQSVDVGTGKFQWYKNWAAADLEGTAAKLWFEADQEGVDPADRDTWKPCSALPGCEDTCSAKAFWITGCVKIGIDDEMSRPDRVQDAYALVDCQLAELAEMQLLRTMDFYSRPRYFDASALGTLGAAAALPLGLVGILQKLTALRQYGGGSQWTAYVPRHLVDVVAADMMLAQENIGMAEAAVSNIFGLFGITDVVFTKDWACEGPLIDGFADEDPEDCALDPGTLAEACVAFGTGEPVEVLNNSGRIRLIQKNDFRFGQSGVFDYALRRSPELMDQNCAQWRGETAEILFKTGSCAPSFFIDVDNLCVTGNRVYPDVSLACDVIAAPGTGVNVPVLAAKAAKAKAPAPAAAKTKEKA